MSTGSFAQLPNDARGLNGYAVHPAEWRFAQFLGLPNVAAVAARYSELLQTGEGSSTAIQLAQLAMHRAYGGMCQVAYWRAVRDLAGTTTIPLRDFLEMAGCQLEQARSVLAVRDAIPFNPGPWDAEWAAEGESE